MTTTRYNVYADLANGRGVQRLNPEPITKTAARVIERRAIRAISKLPMAALPKFQPVVMEVR